MSGIVLARTDFREYDQIITIYTKTRGKQSFIARGVKRSTSKNTSLLLEFSSITFGTVSGKEWQYITNVHRENYFTGIRNNIQKSVYAGIAIRGIERMLKHNEQDELLFGFFYSWLLVLDQTKSCSSIILDYFFLQVLSFLGFSPELERYGDSEQMVKNESAFFSFSSGCFLYNTEDIEQTVKYGFVLSCSARRVLLQLQKGVVQDVSNSVVKEVHSFVYAFACFCLETPLLDWKMAEKWLD
tara:strand:- start:1337 stop:2062 length:726 start_codon:yes stop_codon:yes gene_type:complete